MGTPSRLHEQLWHEFRPIRAISDRLLEQERSLLLRSTGNLYATFCEGPGLAIDLA